MIFNLGPSEDLFHSEALRGASSVFISPIYGFPSYYYYNDPLRKYSQAQQEIYNLFLRSL